MADWKGLPNDLLFEIGKRLTLIESYDSFGAVCRSWRAAAPRDKKHLKLKTLGSPLFMLPQKKLSKLTKFWGYWTTLIGGESSTDMREFYSVSTGKTRKLFLPEATKKFCLSWKDWLFIFEEDGTHTSLLHLVSRVQIHLPNLNVDTFPAYHLERVVLSANPNSASDFTVIILLGTQLYLYKSGNTSWTAIIDKSKYEACLMIYLNGYLYTFDDDGEEAVKLDISGQNPIQLQQIFGHLPPEQISEESENMPVIESSYMVEFLKKCYIVCKHACYCDFPRGTHRTNRFEVYEANTEDVKSGWTEIKNLGNKAIFLGDNSLFVIECSEINKCKPNCIYFMDNIAEYYQPLLRGDGQDRGIYHLSDGSIEPLYDEKIEWSQFGEPLWIGPSA